MSAHWYVRSLRRILLVACISFLLGEILGCTVHKLSVEDANLQLPGGKSPLTPPITQQ